MTKKLRILITNDDGIDAPGLGVLCEAAKSMAPNAEIWVVAPHIHQSGVSQSITMNVPVYILDHNHKKQFGEQRFAVTGTPADCVILAMNELMRTCPPNVILSGINKGINIGNDVNMSGTLGAAYMGATYGIPSIAISMEVSEARQMRWDTARGILPALLSDLIEKGGEKNFCLSINIPDLPADQIAGTRWTQPAYDVNQPINTKAVTDLRGETSYFIHPAHYHKSRVYDAASDATALKQNEISISAISHRRLAPAE